LDDSIEDQIHTFHGNDIMTAMLEQAFQAASRLPELDQNALARWLLAEIGSERQWEHQFAESEDLLAQLALEALEEDAQGRTTALDAGRL
jgi:hypothetical protein